MNFLAETKNVNGKAWVPNSVENFRKLLRSRISPSTQSSSSVKRTTAGRFIAYESRVLIPFQVPLYPFLASVRLIYEHHKMHPHLSSSCDLQPYYWPKMATELTRDLFRFALLQRCECLSGRDELRKTEVTPNLDRFL